MPTPRGPTRAEESSGLGLRAPRPLRPGDVVRVVAPSGPFEAALGWAGLGWLATRYKVRFDRAMFRPKGYLAGSDARRRAELEAALADPDAGAVLAMRGGYGASRFVHELDWSVLARSPKWLVGFSDVTALHVEAARVGVASVHGPNVSGLGRGDLRAREELVRLLEDPFRLRVFEGLEALVPGRAKGPLFGGNLTLLHATAAAGRLRVPPGSVVLLEDVTERPYRIDRMLATLQVGGHFRAASGFVLGEFTACEAGPDGICAAEVLAEHLGRLGVPVVSGLPVGHGKRNEPVVLGAEAEIVAEGRAGRVSLGLGPAAPSA